jgi:predicted DNA-binding protein (MmcQ/YjbR family)
MKAWSAALADEVTGWPHVNMRAFFGFTALYREEKMFALLPRTRGMGTANSLAFKLETKTAAVLTMLEKDPRIASTQMQKTRWFTFEVSSNTDLRAALHWLGQAYEAAGKNIRSR